MTSSGKTNYITYKDAGVDIAAGAALVEAIKPLTRATARPGAGAEVGGFGGVFDLAAAGYKDPLLVSGTDGVGTKLRVAIDAGRHDGVGIDLVAMCVNDIVTRGAEPLYFLDYLGTGQLDTSVARDVVAGIAEGCRIAGCALIGGETAEMPGMYPPGDYDLAGFAVGAVEREALLSGHSIGAGDVVLGLASDGLHSNGFSLVRRIVEDLGIGYHDPAPFADQTSLGDVLLTPTRIYVASCLAAARQGGVKALAHITGGGLLENLPRVLPDGLGAEIDTATWSPQPVFGWLAAAGGIAGHEMARTFNCGIGMIVVAAREDAAAVAATFTEHGETVHRIGTVIEGAEVTLRNAEAPWPS